MKEKSRKRKLVNKIIKKKKQPKTHTQNPEEFLSEVHENMKTLKLM